jgi:glycosyltransferase involved in cell wall biosynthesis
MKENKLKILVITGQNPFINSNAPSNRLLTLAEGMVANGVKVDMLFIEGYNNVIEKVKFLKSGNFKSINYEYLNFYNYSNFIIRNLFYRIIPDKFLVDKIINKIKSGNYDYLWLGMNPRNVNIGLDIFKMKLNIKFVHERSEYSWIGFHGKDKLHQKYLNQFLPHIDYFAIMTKTLIDYYKDFVGKKTRMIHIPMTVDFSRFDGEITNNKLKKPYIGYCGTMDIKKDGVDILISSFINIMNEFPDHNLYIAGPLVPEKDYKYLKSLMVTEKIRERIIFLGSLTRDKIPEFLMNSDILAMARPDTKQAEGGFPTKLGEYLATGKPVCVTNVGEICNYLKNNESAFISDPDSVESFTDAILRALKSENAKQIGLNGRNVALKHFNKEIQAKMLVDFLAKE